MDFALGQGECDGKVQCLGTVEFYCVLVCD